MKKIFLILVKKNNDIYQMDKENSKERKYNESLTKIKKVGRPKKVNKGLEIKRGCFIVEFQ